MTLKEIFDKINEVALKQPAISEIIRSGNVYDLNEMRTAKYAVFCAVQSNHSTDLTAGTTTYNFFLYYIDRLASDKDNKINIQSTAIETLKNILMTLAKEEDIEYTNCDFTVFTESFDGICAGAYAAVGITAPDEGCVEEFD